MFDAEKHAPWRPVDPPAPVLIDLGTLWPPTRLRWGGDTPPWVRAQGLRVDDVVPGSLVAWVITSCGDWLALCRFSVRIGGEQLAVEQLVPASAVRRKE